MASKTSAANEMLVSALSGVAAGVISKTVTYPLETIKTCLANKSQTETSLEVIRALWPIGMYKGIHLRLSKSVYHNFAFFYIMEGIAQLAKTISDRVRRMRQLPPLQEQGTLIFLLAGFCGDAFNVPILAPLDYVLSQVQTSKSDETVTSVVKRTWREQGLSGFYVAWPIYFLSALRPAVKFYLIELVRSILLKGRGRTENLSAWQGFWLGAISNALTSTFFYPINTARIVIMSRRRTSSEVKGKSNVFEVIADIARNEGIGGLYKGLTSEISEGTLGSAIHLAVKETVTTSVRAIVST